MPIPELLCIGECIRTSYGDAWPHKNNSSAHPLQVAPNETRMNILNLLHDNTQEMTNLHLTKVSASATAKLPAWVAQQLQ